MGKGLEGMSLEQGSQIGAFFLPKEHLAMSGGILGCYNVGIATGTYFERPGMLRPLRMHRTLASLPLHPYPAPQTVIQANMLLLLKLRKPGLE